MDEWSNNNKLTTLAKKIRYNKKIFPNGINVNFFKILDKSTIEVKTYEKGVEDLMMSCGSGSVACVYHLSKIGKIQSPVTVNTLGGQLQIDFTNEWQEVWLSGPAEIANSTEFNLD